MGYALKIGEEYSKGEIESIFETNFGWLIKGITLRRDRDGEPYTLLFSKENGPYGDMIIDNILYFTGERQKCQTPTIANKALIESNTTNRKIYGFRKGEKKASWKYIGMLKVVDFDYKRKNGFMTFEYKLSINGAC